MANVFLTDTQVGERYGVHRTTVWRWGKTDPTFPKPLSLTPGCVRFRLSDLEAWENSKAAPTADQSAA